MLRSSCKLASLYTPTPTLSLSHTHTHIHFLGPPFCARSVSKLSYLGAPSKGNVAGHTVMLPLEQGRHTRPPPTASGEVTWGPSFVKGALLRDRKELQWPRIFRSANRLLWRKNRSLFTVSCCKSSLFSFQPKHQMLISHKDVKGCTSLQEARVPDSAGASGEPNARSD